MQIFVKVLDGSTKVIEPESTDTIRKIMHLIEEIIAMPAPRQRILYSGKQLDEHRTLEECKITRDSTLHLVGRLAPQLYIKWQGQWLSRKDDDRYYMNFYHDLCCGNEFTFRDSQKIEWTASSTTNLTIYHLKKLVAKFLLLEPSDIDLTTLSEDKALDNSQLLDRVMSLDFIAKLKPNLCI